ncbi:MAG: hypothetical protein JWO05_2025 [Gemmatimonadetes bacterium]|nr:hypothetical protein [Gemmatimonadota bacterium]
MLEIANALTSAGHETWCVGGAVRDALLGQAHLDWDLATSATPEQVRQLFGYKRTIPVGIEFGTVGVLDRDRKMHEVTTFRRDVKTDGRHAVVEFGASLDDDLARRDFTINAIAYSPSERRVHDPFGGRADLQKRVVRAVGDPEQRMREDRLRALRGIRFAARFDFPIEAPTWRAILASAPHLGRLSPERVKQELEKTMEQVARPGAAMTLWRDSGALTTLIPALGRVDDAILSALDLLPRPRSGPRAEGRKLDRLATLFSGLGEEGALQVLSALRFSKRDAAWVAATVGAWHTLERAVTSGAGALQSNPEAMRRLVAAMGRLQLYGAFRVAAVRWAARSSDPGATATPTSRELHALYRRARVCALREPIALADLAVDGDDLRRAGIPPGPQFGKILHLLLDLVLADPARNEPAGLLDEARRLHASHAT